ncbi:MAG TPA: hypothetical protein VGB73_00495 [Pyrinomonadaceae bacterium]
MALAPVTLNTAKRGKAVYTSKELPLGFNNKKPIPARTKGYIKSDGFEAGVLQVHFPLWAGDEHARFNELSARAYLECDPFF